MNTNNHTHQELTKEAEILLLMIRCGYVNVPGFGLSLKATYGLPTWVWRTWNKILCACKPGHEKALYDFLSSKGALPPLTTAP